MSAFGKKKAALAGLAIGVLACGGSALATTLQPGDIAIYGFNTTTTDGIDIVPLINLQPGDTFTITDNGWQAAGSFRTTEGQLTFTALSTISAGTIVNWTNGQSVTGTGWSSGNPSNFALNSGGESLTVFTGTLASPTLIYALQSSTTGWDADGTSSSTSARPVPPLTTTLTPPIPNNNGFYSGPTTAADQATWLTRIGDPANWTSSASLQTLPSGSIAMTPEPSGLGVLGLAGGLLFRRRRKA